MEERKSIIHNSICEAKEPPEATKKLESNGVNLNCLTPATEVEDLSFDLDEPVELSPELTPGTLIVENAVASWVDGAEPVINNISFQAPPGSLVAIIGTVGSGKSSLIQSMLGELPLTSGQAMVVARAVSYSSQEPWIFSGTIKENIIFGRPFDRRRYNQVKTCFIFNFILHCDKVKRPINFMFL
jgi:ABC-type multidrug transport system fused ATPase/permease subunit